MLHQQLWNLFLRLHRGSLSSQNDRSSCQLLAQHIISTEAQIQERCTVCSTISTGSNQLVNAATVLVIDLLFPANASNEADSVSQLGRLMARDKIQEAVTLLDKRGQNDHSSPPYDAGQGFTKPSTRKCSLALQSLMELEKEQSNTSAERNGRHCDENAEILKRKVKEVLELLEGNSNKTSVTNHRNSPLNPFPSEKLSTCLPVTTGTPDLDVLPLVSNDPDWNFWQFFDFSAGFPTPSPGTDRDHVFPTPADVLRSNEFTPFTPSSTDVDFWEAPFWPGDASE
jgi:hypothetical protein